MYFSAILLEPYCHIAILLEHGFDAFWRAPVCNCSESGSPPCTIRESLTVESQRIVLYVIHIWITIENI